MGINISSLFLDATIVVKLIMILLILMSVYSWATIVAKGVGLHAAKTKSTLGLGRFGSVPDLRQAVQGLGGDPDSPLYTVAQEGVLEFNRSREMSTPDSVVVDNVRRALHQGVNTELDNLNKGLSVLATCANTAPFIGLFGTVWGIMNAFISIGQMRSASLATVAPGISEALVATAMGLFVAIPATIFYNTYLGKLNSIESTLVNFAGVFLNSVQREITASSGRQIAQTTQTSQVAPPPGTYYAGKV